MGKQLSVIIPAYNEERMIGKAVNTIKKILDEEAVEHEIIFVDDGSKDNTWQNICIEAGQNRKVRGISFSRNFGKEAAIFAGMLYCQGDCCVIIDCDLQHPPEKIIEMYRLWEQGYEVIEAVKTDRGRESFLHSISAAAFYHIISRVTHLDMSHASDFKLLDRKAITVLLNMKEKNAFFRALSSWIGFKTRQVEFSVQERTEGESKWSLWSLIKYAVSNVTSFSTAPMQMVTILGVLTMIMAIVQGSISLCQKITGAALGGFTTMILLQLFTGSVIMISLGIIGYYISKIYDEIKARPRFIVTAECGEIVNEHNI